MVRGSCDRQPFRNRASNADCASKNLFCISRADVCAVLAVWRMEGTRASASLVNIRNALFTTFVSDPKQMEPAPAELDKSGFVRDSADEIAKWHRTLDNLVRYHELFARLGEASSTVEKAKLITLSFSRNGSPMLADGTPTWPYDKSADLLFKMSTIIQPRLLQRSFGSVCGAWQCMRVGLHKARSAHTTCSFYSPELKKWIWIDPQFALLAKGVEGDYLSPSELFEFSRKRQPINYEFFGLPEHMFAKMDPRDHELYRPESFSPIYSVTWGNNVLTYDEFRRQWLFVPKSIRQTFWHVVGLCRIIECSTMGNRMSRACGG